MPADNLSPSTPPVGGHKPSPAPRARAAASRISRLQRLKPASKFRSLSRPVKLALVILDEETELTESGHFWRAPSGKRIVYQTVEAMFERGLVIVVYPGPRRRAHRKVKVNEQTRAKFSIRLTEVGSFLARGLKTNWDINAPHLCGDQFEDATLVYGDGEA